MEPCGTRGELESLFSWCPPPVVPVPVSGADPDSDSPPPPPTDASAFYDKHLAPELTLARVVAAPSVVAELARVARTTAYGVRASLPPFAKGLFPEEFRAVLDGTRDTHARSAGAVRALYAGGAAEYCIPAASTLAFHPYASTWDTVVECAFDHGDREDAEEDGMCEAALRMSRRYVDVLLERRAPDAREESVVGAMQGAGTHAGLRMLAEHHGTRALMTWMFAHPDAAPAENLAEYVAGLQGRRFEWTRCGGSLREEARKARAGVRVPPDALDTPWSRPRPGVVGPFPGIEADMSWVAIDEQERGEVEAHSNFLDLEDDDHTSHRMLEEMWATSVRRDGTLVVLHAGNYEYIGVRHRASRTLYISSLVNPPECPSPRYGQLQIGLCIAAVRDAMDRLQQEKLLGSPHASVDEYGEEDVRCMFSGLSVRDPEHWRVAEQLRRCDALLVYLRYDVYDSPVPATLVRVRMRSPDDPPSAPSSPLCPQHPPPAGCALSLVLTTPLGRSAAGTLLGGVARVHTHPHSHSHSRAGSIPGVACIAEGACSPAAHGVVAKIADREAEWECLRREYKVYRQLAARQVAGAPVVYGYFTDVEGEAEMLVMGAAGTPLSRRSEPLSPLQRDAFMSALAAIHEAGVLHGDIQLQNLAVDGAGSVCITGFEKATVNAFEEDMLERIRETKRLEKLLDVMVSSRS